MSTWKKIKRGDGATVYMKIDFHGEGEGRKAHSRFVALKNVPPAIMDKFDVGKNEIDDFGLDLNAPSKLCVFCGMASKYTKMINGQTIYLCDEHYYSKNLGQVAQRLKEVADEKEAKQAA